MSAWSGLPGGGFFPPRVLETAHDAGKIARIGSNVIAKSEIRQQAHFIDVHIENQTF